MIKKILRRRKNRPLFLIDIAVPRDIEPKVNSLENVFLYDIDDLKEVVNDNSAQRMQEAVRAERIIEEEVIKFSKWLSTLDVVPTIVLLKEKIEEIRKAELKRSMSQLQGLTDEQIEAIETLTLSMTEKMINDPILALKIFHQGLRGTHLLILQKGFLIWIKKKHRGSQYANRKDNKQDQKS
jgi:glutamyl-tRNA reductase